MKITYVLLFIFSMLFCSEGMAQKVSLKFKNVEILTVFKEIEKQTKFSFVYSEEHLARTKKIDLSLHNENLELALQLIFKDQPLTYTIVGKHIVLKEKLIIPLKNGTFIVPATKYIYGTVTNEVGGALPGTNILEKGTRNGVQSDLDGNFSIELANNKAVMQLSYIGYAAIEVTVGELSTFNIILSKDTQALEDVVVNVSGFKEKRDDIASTYSVIDVEDISRSKEPTLINSLAGKAAGLSITGTSADPGAGSNIQIRGVSSINGSSPLIVVDGIPLNNSNLEGIASGADAGVSQQSRLNDINLDDIETIQIFKGASAGALFGSQALGGVVVITTKRGKAGKLKASVTSTVSIDKINRRHSLQTNYGQGSGGKYSPTAANSWGDKIADRVGGDDTVNTSGRYFKAADGTLYYPIITKNSKNVYRDSNFDQIFQDGITQDIKFNLSGGNEKGTFYFSASHLDQEGIIKQSNYLKSTITFGNTYKFNDWLDTSAKVSYINSSSNRIQQGSNTAGIYLGLLRNPADFDISDYIGTYYDNLGAPTALRHRSYRRYMGDTENPTYNNPLWTINEQISETVVGRVFGSIDFNIKATPWLNFVLRSGLDTYNDDRVYFFPMFSGDGANRGRYQNEIYKNTELSADLISLMNFNLTEKLSAKVTVGSALNDRKRKQIYVEAIDFLFNSRLQNASIASVKDEQELNRRIRNVRLYGQSSFDYNEVLNLNLGLTYEDASSSVKSIIYPSVEVGFKWSELLQLDTDSPLSFAKLRLAYGEVGLAPEPHGWETGYETATYSGYSDGISLTAFGSGYRLNDDQGNPYLEFEKKKEYEAGLDFRFFRNKLKLSGTYYFNKTDDMLLPISLNPSSGYDTLLGNVASLQNKGFEFEFDYNFLKKKDFSVDVYGNVSTNKGEVTDLAGVVSVDFTPGSSTKSAAVVGQPVGILLGSAALRKSDGSLDLDANGFPQLDTTGDKVLGDPNPDWKAAAGIQINYKNFSVNALFDTSQGNDIAERTRYVLYGFGAHADVGNEVILTQDLKNFKGVTVASGSTVRGNIQNFGNGPVLLDESWYTTLGGGIGGSVINEFAVADASWTRLRELSLSYSLRGNLIKKTGMESIDLSITGRNLALWTKIKGIDPDVNQYGTGVGKGIDYFTNPSSKSVVFGMKINL
ncbi:TonB-linked outer membrane protein, SusC/RagA family [Flavobacterium gillisiae]|uniref:TonB-linked outer membrane protein, SusC/RagA family n=1 Tax=Flavobacterium gillisiae TaxID=150146 RepID=A0A1H4CPN2_9FLAO|nr:SusC/RagA family TonB-linked outer membrane protein [Flavobacterium gillisiae]SEA62279.1 TonB-linked outer membrane protein, SusC/RagA family [Flavobacterium gillisiae]